MIFENIIPTQNYIRNKQTVFHYYNLISKSMDPFSILEKIPLAIFPDGKLYAMDAHHRLVALYICKIKGVINNVPDSMFVTNPFSYKEYEEVNINVGWVTPHCVKTHVRVSDLYNWKSSVLKIKDLEKKEKYILSNTQRFLEVREVFSIKDLCYYNFTQEELKAIK